MHFITAIRQSWRNRWKQAARASLTIALLSAVAVLGLTLLGSKVIAAWKAPGNAERALASGGAFEELLNFEAPDATVARREAQKEEFEKGMKSASNGMRVKNWKFTAEMVNFMQQLTEFRTLNPNQAFSLQNFTNDAQQIFAFGQLVVGIDFLVDMGRTPPFTTFQDRLLQTIYNLVVAWLTAYNNLVDSLGFAFLAKPPLPPIPSPASPFF